MKLNILNSLIAGLNQKNVFHLILSFAFIILAIVGGINSYSPVPFWDMWDGYIDFDYNISNGDYGVWWRQHNEHRILLSRLIFFICFSFFNGQLWFLIIINYVLLFLIVYLFLRILNEFLTVDFIWFKFFIIIFLCSWMQSENLTWGFQNQFFLAYLMPLASLFYLYKSQNENTFSPNFLLSMILGILASGSLAIGSLFLPILSVYSIFMKMNWRRTIVLILSGIVIIFVYAFDYKSPNSDFNLIDGFLNEPLKLLTYIVHYIGNPFYYIFGEGKIGGVIAGLFGAFFILSVILFTILYLFYNVFKPVHSVFLFFLYYFITNAIMTGVGRSILGLEQAFSSRYTTPTLMGWACLISIYIGLTINFRLKIANTFQFTLIFLSGMLFLVQLDALKLHKRIRFEKNIAALSLELGINDEERISKIYPNSSAALKYSQHASENNLSVFGIFPLVDLENKMATKITDNIKIKGNSLGNLDKMSPINTDNRYVFLEGWLFNKIDKTTPELFYITNETGVIVGAVLTGNPRDDIANIIDRKAKYSGFNGYLDRNFAKDSLYFISYDFSCTLPFCIPDNN